MSIIIEFILYIGLMILHMVLRNYENIIIQNLNFFIIIAAGISLAISIIHLCSKNIFYMVQLTPLYIISFIIYINSVLLLYNDILNNIFSSETFITYTTQILISFAVASVIIVIYFTIMTWCCYSDSLAKFCPILFWLGTGFLSIFTIIYDIYLFNNTNLIVAKTIFVISLFIIFLGVIEVVKLLLFKIKNKKNYSI